MRRLNQLHDCIALLFRDPVESGRLRSGFVRVREAETGREFVTLGRRQWFDAEALPRELKRAGIDHLVLRTDESIEPALRQLFRARGWIGRGAR